MHHSVLALAFVGYFGLNLLCALVLHLRALSRTSHQPHPLEVVVHFVVLTVFGLPVLLVVATVALFSKNSRQEKPLEVKVAPEMARAA